MIVLNFLLTIIELTKHLKFQIILFRSPATVYYVQPNKYFSFFQCSIQIYSITLVIRITVNREYLFQL